jgi:hypothetical protein
MPSAERRVTTRQCGASIMLSIRLIRIPLNLVVHADRGLWHLSHTTGGLKWLQSHRLRW